MRSDRTEDRRGAQRPRRRWAAGAWRATHVWFGLLTAVGVIVVSITGILLNHTRALGWGGEGPPAVSGTGTIAHVLPMHDLLKAALVRGGDLGIRVVNDRGFVLPATGPSDVDRAMFRPGTSTAQVRLKDPAHTEFVLDWSTAEVLDVRARRDVRLDHLHSGEAAAQRGVILSDIVAVAIVLLVGGGIVIWIRRLIDRRAIRERGSRWLRANWWFHLVGGLVVAIYAVILCVTGVILNHKREWGFLVEPVRSISDEVVARRTNLPIGDLMSRAVDERRSLGEAAALEDVSLLDYRPSAGYVKVRFSDLTEVILDASEGTVFSVAGRRDRWVEDLHSGVRFGEQGWWLSDITAGVLILLTINGLYLWARPAAAGRSGPGGEDGA